MDISGDNLSPLLYVSHDLTLAPPLGPRDDHAMRHPVADVSRTRGSMDSMERQSRRAVTLKSAADISRLSSLPQRRRRRLLKVCCVASPPPLALTRPPFAFLTFPPSISPPPNARRLNKGLRFILRECFVLMRVRAADTAGAVARHGCRFCCFVFFYVFPFPLHRHLETRSR